MFGLLFIVILSLSLMVGIAYEIFKILITIFCIGAVILFIIFSIVLFVLMHKKFFNKYEEGWRKICSRILKYGLILELISNIICFAVCLYIKCTLKL